VVIAPDGSYKIPGQATAATQPAPTTAGKTTSGAGLTAGPSKLGADTMVAGPASTGQSAFPGAGNSGAGGSTKVTVQFTDQQIKLLAAELRGGAEAGTETGIIRGATALAQGVNSVNTSAAGMNTSVTGT
jgi:hypothetical protein